VITIQEIKDIRIHLKITQVEFGRFLGYSKSFISRIETGERSLDDSEILKAQDVLERLIISNRRAVNSAQQIMNRVKSRVDCQQALTDCDKNPLSSGGNLLL
jgi:predicted transcriptional regulator